MTCTQNDTSPSQIQVMLVEISSLLFCEVAIIQSLQGKVDAGELLMEIFLRKRISGVLQMPVVISKTVQHERDILERKLSHKVIKWMIVLVLLGQRRFPYPRKSLLQIRHPLPPIVQFPLYWLLDQMGIMPYFGQQTVERSHFNRHQLTKQITRRHPTLASILIGLGVADPSGPLSHSSRLHVEFEEKGGELSGGDSAGESIFAELDPHAQHGLQYEEHLADQAYSRRTPSKNRNRVLRREVYPINGIPPD